MGGECADLNSQKLGWRGLSLGVQSCRWGCWRVITKGQVLPGKKVMWSFLGHWGGFEMFLDNYF